MLSNLDWEQHRQDYLSALNRDPAYAAALVKHTILHWQSLFAAGSNPFNIDKLFEESFEARPCCSRVAAVNINAFIQPSISWTSCD